MITPIAGIFHRRNVGPGRVESGLLLDGARTERDGNGAIAGHGTLHGAQLIGDISVDAPSGTRCVLSARVDNRHELIRALGVPASSSRSGVPEDLAVNDGRLIHAAYLRWGPRCVDRICGDWAFAVWDPRHRRLFLARDQSGITSLYYSLDHNTFAFATDQQALIDLRGGSAEIDDLYLAQMLVSWTAYHGHGTARIGINRLPPAHFMTVDERRSRVEQYWHLEDTPPLRLRHRDDYVEGFLEVFDEAVGARLRGCRSGDVGTTLSGGLDSSSVTVTAASMMGDAGVKAYTAVPIADTTPFTGPSFGDEWPSAEAAAIFAGNVRLAPITAANCTPIAGIRRYLSDHLEPGHAAGNYYWMTELYDRAVADGCQVLLVGQEGNSGMSWAGSPLSGPVRAQLRAMGLQQWLRLQAKRRMPRPLFIKIRQLRAGDDPFNGTALSPRLAKSLDLANRRLADPREWPARTPLAERAWSMPGRTFGGALTAQSGRAAGLEIRDPSGDSRLLSYTWSLPEEIFRDPTTGMDRWLMRTAMRGRLPDTVRLNRRIGMQAADLPVRLRLCAAEVESALSQVAASEAATRVVDVARMRQAWHIVAREDSRRAYRLSVVNLTRGLAVGLFLAAEAGDSAPMESTPQRS